MKEIVWYVEVETLVNMDPFQIDLNILSVFRRPSALPRAHYEYPYSYIACPALYLALVWLLPDVRNDRPHILY